METNKYYLMKGNGGSRKSTINRSTKKRYRDKCIKSFKNGNALCVIFVKEKSVAFLTGKSLKGSDSKSKS